jgi:hypothetical protein
VEFLRRKRQTMSILMSRIEKPDLLFLVEPPVPLKNDFGYGDYSSMVYP